MPHKDRWQVCFLTGYPTFLAKNLVEGILAWYPQAIVALLVQSKYHKDAKAFVRKIGAGRRARVVTGDVLNMHLGLSSDEYSILTNNVTHIFHAASASFAGTPEKTAYNINVIGTRNMLDLASDARNLGRFNHFSSAFVSGGRTGVVTEDELDRGQRFTDHIQRTKFLAEKEVRAAADRVPASVFRPSMVVGNSITGEVDRLEGFYSFVKLILTPGFNLPLPVPRRGAAPLNVVPVDFVTEAALHIADRDDAAGKTFHLVDPNPLPVRKVLEMIAKKAGRPGLSIVPLPGRVTEILSKVKWVSRLSPAYVNATDILGRFTIYNCSNTIAALKDSAITCPSFDGYADRMLDFVKGSLSRQKEAEAEKALKDPLA
ncbi:MAG: SDR family oxidoreductase [Deltaproteobacteria bacterium]|nr:SDR family oxidoreductase [Deltaproteobacteria bacterium]